MMKAISLWNPWAEAMRRGMKKQETRSWQTPYRGPLAICSTQRPICDIGKDVMELTSMNAYGMEFGAVLCVVELTDMVPTEFFHGTVPLKISQMEADLGDYSPGRFAWVTTNCRPLKTPLPIRGQQGLWTLTAEQVAEIERRV